MDSKRYKITSNSKGRKLKNSANVSILKGYSIRSDWLIDSTYNKANKLETSKYWLPANGTREFRRIAIVLREIY